MSGQKTPVAIRITRPYQTEDEFLARELETISRTGVTLGGAQQRPEGIVLRFELALANGTPLLRGEGRVVGYKAHAFGSEPGLSLRFTRLDSKSKALVDRVGAMRDVRRSIPPPAASPGVPAMVVPAAPSSPIAIPEAPMSEPVPISVEPPVSSSDVLAPPLKKAEGPHDKEALLARLRQRSAFSNGSDASRILAEGAARRRG